MPTNGPVRVKWHGMSLNDKAEVSGDKEDQKKKQNLNNFYELRVRTYLYALFLRFLVIAATLTSVTQDNVLLF